MVNGYVTNNTGRSRHIFKRTVYPGQRIPLALVYKVLSKKVPEDQQFVDWLDGYLPSGWEIEVASPKKEVSSEVVYRETIVAIPVVEPSPEPPIKEVALKRELGVVKEPPDMQYATLRAIDKMSAKDIFNIRIKDGPKRILKNIDSVHKLRRALTLCKNDSRKDTLIRLIKGRIRELNIIL